MKKLSFLLAIILMLSACLMTACKKDDEVAPEEKPPIVHASIATEQLANYTIISAKSSSREVDEVAEQLRVKIQSTFDVLIDSKTENAYNKTQYEILIGNTGREESITFLADMRWDDYGYGIVGNKLVIAGKNEDGTIKALRAFLDYVNKHEGGEVFFSNADKLLAQKDYPHEGLTVNDISVSELSILCNEQALGGIAQVIRNAIIKACGIAVPIVTDDEIDELQNAIVIGETEKMAGDAMNQLITHNGSQYSVNTFGSNTFIKATTAAGYWSAAAEITKQFSNATDENVILTVGKRDGIDAIPVMSFNLMAATESNRLNSVVETILKYRPAVVGVQEATDMWIGLLNQKLGEVYTIVGDGRSATKGDEHSAILFLKDEFELIQTETKWLSDTPDAPGSQFAEAHYTRIMTYALLSRKSDGKQFLHVNTHLDYGSSDAEEQVKVKQMQVIFDEIAKLNLDVPTIITGDFNANVGSPVYNKVIGEGYSEAAAHIPATNRAPTYHGLMGTTGAPSHIDFIFAKGLANDNLYRICTERIDNENVSDHYPILSILSFLTEE